MALDHGRRVPLRGFQIAAIFCTRDFDQAFGCATHRADLFTQGGARTLRRALVTEAAHHATNISGLSPDAPSVEKLCNGPAYRVRVATVWRGVIPFRGFRVSPKSDTVTENPNRLCGV